MTGAELLRANGLYARFIHLMNRPDLGLTHAQEQELVDVAEALEELGIEHDLIEKHHEHSPAISQ